MGFVFCAILKSVLTRLLFMVHCLVTVWRVVDVYQDRRYWILMAAMGLLCIEGIITLVRRKGRELKWFCPSFLFYLCGVVPAIWFLELDRLHRYRTRQAANETEPAVNVTMEKLSAIEGFELPVHLDPDMWVNSIEQSMLLLLIVGRWLLPKGDITRDQLSQLLFVYIGMASDIMELYYLFQEPVVLHDILISYVILGVWSLSLFQFTLVLTATKARKPRVALNQQGEMTANSKHCCSCCESEIWSILVMVFFQDAPFLATRLYVSVTYRLFSYNIVFFTAKNALIILLQVYRVIVICVERDSSEEDLEYEPEVKVKLSDNEKYQLRTEENNIGKMNSKPSQQNDNGYHIDE